MVAWGSRYRLFIIYDYRIVYNVVLPDPDLCCGSYLGIRYGAQFAGRFIAALGPEWMRNTYICV
jgi:hypothetical protein